LYVASKRILTELYKSTFVGLIIGNAIGLALGFYLIANQYFPLVFFESGQRVAAVFFFMAVLGLLGSGLLGVLGTITGVALILLKQPAGIPTQKFYIGIGLIVAIVFNQLLKAIFLHTRDITSVQSITVISSYAGIAIVLTSLLFLLTLKKRPLSTERFVHVKTLISILCVWFLVFYFSVQRLVPKQPQLANRSVDNPKDDLVRSTDIDSTAGMPNVILISIDTLRSDHLSCYGYRRSTSPNIDEVARQGAMFVNSYAQAPWTLPSHATMMTSLYPSSHGVKFMDNIRFGGYYINMLDKSHTTLAEILKANGYKTWAITSVIWLSSRFNMDQGFDRMDVNPEQHTAEAILKKARRWISKTHDEPFFLFLHFFDVHNYESPASFENLYQSSEYNGALKDDPTIVMSNTVESMSEQDINYVTNLYDGSINYVDYQLGLFFDWMKKNDRYENSLIIITSDHGEEFWEHGGKGHGFTLYEEQLKVPLIIKAPNNNETRSHQPRSLVGVIDITPTVLDYIGLPSRSNFEGISLRPLMEKRANVTRKLFAEGSYFFNSMAVFDGSYKYINYRLIPPVLFNRRFLLSNIRSLYKFKDSELFNLAENRLERENVAMQNEQVELKMAEWVQDHVNHIKLENTKEMDEKSVDQLKSLGYIN